MTIIQRVQQTNFNLFDFIAGIHYFTTGVVSASYDYEIIRMLFRNSVEDLSVHWYDFKAGFYRNTGNFIKTIKTYENAAYKTVQKSLFYSKIGDLLVEMQNPQKAADFYRQALSTAQDDIVLWAKLAELLQNFNRGNIGEIIECFTQISRLEPNNSSVFYELGHTIPQKRR